MPPKQGLTRSPEFHREERIEDEIHRRIEEEKHIGNVREDNDQGEEILIAHHLFRCVHVGDDVEDSTGNL